MNAFTLPLPYTLQHRLGGAVYDGGRMWIGPGPDGANTSLSVLVGDDGHCFAQGFNGDRLQDCARHLGLDDFGLTLLSNHSLDRVRQLQGLAPRNPYGANAGRHAWREATPVEGTLAERYLLERGLHGPFSGDLRFNPAAPPRYADDVASPALLVLQRRPDGSPQALQVLGINPDAPQRKAPYRHTFGSALGSAVQLQPIADRVLALAQGVVAATKFTEQAGIPCWACTSPNAMRSFRPPPGVQRLLILAGPGSRQRAAAFSLAMGVRNLHVTVLSLRSWSSMGPTLLNELDASDDDRDDISFLYDGEDLDLPEPWA